MQRKGFPVCRYYTVRAYLRRFISPEWRQREYRAGKPGPRYCRFYFGRLRPCQREDERGQRPAHGKVHFKPVKGQLKGQVPVHKSAPQFSDTISTKKIEIPWNFNNSRGIFWQPEKDSNPHKQSQSLSCYPYTIRLSFPLLSEASVIIANNQKMSRGIFNFFRNENAKG